MVKKAFATVSRIVHLMQCREFKFDLTKALDDHGVVKQAFKQPAATRWNSTVRAMVRIEANFEVLNAVLLERGQRQLLATEREALRGAIVVLTPIAWATDAVQKDTCSAEMALELVRKTRDNWHDILTALKPQKDQETVKHVREAVQCALRHLARRELKMSNPLIEMVKSLDPVDGIRGTPAIDGLSKMLASFVQNTKAGDARYLENVLAELRRFIVRPMNVPSNWYDLTSTKDNFPYMTDLHGRLTQFVMTEAFVERSFGTQKRYMTKSRNAMTLGTAEELTFLAMNFPRLFIPPKPPVKAAPRGEDLTIEQHGCMVAALLGGEVEKPRINKRRPEVELKPSCSVVIRLTEGNLEPFTLCV